MGHCSDMLLDMLAPPSRAVRATAALCALAFMACDDVPEDAPSSPAALAEGAAAPPDAGTVGDPLPDAGSCALGDRQFAVDASVVCDDGCNRCRCTREGWSTTLAQCAPVPKIERCSPAELAQPRRFSRSKVLYQKGDLLALEIETPCVGSREGPVKLCWTGELLESNPVQMPLRVISPETSCSSLQMRQKVFGLTALRDAWREAYRDEHGTVLLPLAGAGAIRYTF